MPVYPLGYPIISGKQDGGTTVTNVLSSTPVDPLAPFPWAVRLQTHIPGGNTPLGLYQDVTCTIPCTMDGDPVAAWRDELSMSGVIAIQADTQKQPILVFVSGFPTVYFDAVDDNLLATVGVIVQPLMVFLNAIPNGKGAAFGTISGGANQIIIAPSGALAGLTEEVYAGSAFIDDGAWSGSHLGSYIFNGASFQGYRDGVLNFTGNPGASGIVSNILVGANEGLTITYGGSLISTLIPNPILSTPDFGTVNTYLNTLN